jgi:pimeloyl-ACP methyl ester carboxylesterase
MKLRITTILLTVLLFWGCKKDDTTLSTNADEMFWLTNAGADMPVWVKGNTASKVIILFAHGGPGKGAYSYSGFQTDRLQKKYAVAYWDQRDAGAAAGNGNFDNLTLDQMVEDLNKLVKVLKYRYGSDTKIFLLGHSFGGLLGTAYLVKDNNQSQITAWIEVDGAHDYPACNTLSRQMMIDTGKVEIARGHHIGEWTEVVNYCEASPPNVSVDISYKTNDYAHKVESYVDINHTVNPLDYTSVSSPVSYGINLYKIYLTKKGKKFLETLEPISYTNQLEKIKIPSLLIWGKYDFIVPSPLGYQAYDKIGANFKSIFIMPHSGHTPMNGDTEYFAQIVSHFIETLR